ncbi:DegT/DnrJ/EryC1/StrS family aminotransferase, partial [Akkermansia sp.]
MKKKPSPAPEKKSTVWLSLACTGEAEERFVHEAFESKWVTTVGPNVDAFERELEEYLGETHVVALASGTSALHLGLVMVGVGPGDEVLCQSMTFAASANPII